MDFSTLEGLLGNLKMPSYPVYAPNDVASEYINQRYSTDIQGKPLYFAPTSSGYDPVFAPAENLGMNPNDLSNAMMPYQGAPYAQSELPISLLGGGGSMQSSSIQGFNMGGRLGADIPLDEKVRIALGVSGTSTDVTYGIGQPYGGRANRSDLTAIDATLRDLKNNREFGAEVKKDFSGNPFVSGFFRQRF